MVDESIIEVPATKMGVTSGGLDLEETLLDRENRDIEGASSEIEDEDVALAENLLFKTLSDGSRGGFVLMIRRTFMPKMVPTSLVAWRRESLKYAGMVTTALFTVVQRYASAVSFILSRTIDKISSGD